MRLPQRLQTGVDPSVTLERLLGPRPTGTSVSAYQWDEAAEFASELWNMTAWQPANDARTIEDFLGTRPSDWTARHLYERIELVYEAAHELDRGAEIDLF